MHKLSPLKSRAAASLLAVTSVVASAPAMHALPPSEADHAMVCSVQEIASQVGVDVMKQGGNAVDAAVAVGFALEVVYPFAGNLGGGGFMLVHTKDGKNVFIDYRETAPALATRDMYVGKDGKALSMRDHSGPYFGWRSSGVPGTVAGFALAFKNYGSGKLTWAQLIEPARKLAAEGHVVTAWNADLIMKQAKGLAEDAETKRIYLNGGSFFKAGDTFTQPDLAATFERLQKNGPSEFYEGVTAHKIADAMKEHSGTITLEDLKNYKAIERAPIEGDYRGYHIVTAPPPSSGGLVILQMLKMLEPFDVAALGAESPEKYHLFIEAMRRGYRDRAAYMGDPDFVPVPSKGLLEPQYVAGLMKNFDPKKATPSAGLQPGKPAGWEAIAALEKAKGPAESKETTHFSVVDSDGNAVSNTYTLNLGFGNGITIPGTGLLMNDEMGDFAASPGKANGFGLVQGEADAITPGKRPLSSMSPTFVLKDGKLWFVTGSPGGGTIINTVLEIVTNVIDHKMSMPEAVAERRFNSQWMPDTTQFEAGLDPKTEAALEAMGHKIVAHSNFEGAYQGDGESIMVDPVSGKKIGAPDPRKPDARAPGY